MTSLINKYFELQKKFTLEYGEKTVLLMQVGSFYEILGDENPSDNLHKASVNLHKAGAREISKLLNIILTKKNKNAESSPLMCGFPCVSLSKYLPILIDNGYTVVKYDQTSTTNRDLSEIYSPSMPPLEHIEVGSRDPILMSIYLTETWIGVSSINTSTGDIQIGEWDSFDDVVPILLSLRPAEVCLTGVLIPGVIEIIKAECNCFHNFTNNDTFTDGDGSLRGTYLSKIKDYSQASVQEAYIQKLYGGGDKVSPMLGYIVSLNLDRFSQTGSILSLLFMFDFLYNHHPRFLISPKLPKIMADSSRPLGYLQLPSNTIDQLNLFPKGQSSRSVFDIINYTQTVIGKRHLRWILSHPFTDPVELQRRYTLSNKFAQMSELQFKKIKNHLNNIKDISYLQRNLLCGNLSIQKFIMLHKSYLQILALFQMDLCSSIEQPHVELDSFINDYSKILDLNISDSEHSFPFLPGNKKFDDLQLIIQNSKAELNKIEQELSQKAPVKLTFLDSENRYVFITTNIRAEVIKKDTDKPGSTFFFSSNKSGTKIWSNETDIISEKIGSTQQKLERMAKELYRHLQIEWGQTYNKMFDKLVEFVEIIDVTWSNVMSSKRLNYCCPVLKESHDSFFQCKSLRHPIIETITEYIPNDICLGTDSLDTSTPDGMIVFSLNSGGKSSLLRSVGVAIILAQAGLFVPAESFIFNPFHRIISQVDFTDNLFSSQSSFVTEILGLKCILEKSDQHTLVLADELCKGSEVNSATAIFGASVCHLVEKKVKFLMSTHLHGVSKLPQISDHVKKGKLKIANLGVRIEKDQTIVFLRKLEDGPCDTLYGIEIAKALGLNKEVVYEALNIRNDIVGNPQSFLSTKRSKYNSKKIMDSCEICGYSQVNIQRDLPLDCHHISFQCNAIGNFCGDSNKKHITKNSIENLVALCKSCHQNVHAKKIIINGYIQTTNGKKLDWLQVT